MYKNESQIALFCWGFFFSSVWRRSFEQNKQPEYITTLRELVTDVSQYMFDLSQINIDKLDYKKLTD